MRDELVSRATMPTAEMVEKLRRNADEIEECEPDPRLLYEAADRIDAQAAEIAELKALVRERDGGVHDQDCKALRSYGPKKCTCGHDAVDAVLTR